MKRQRASLVSALTGAIALAAVVLSAQAQTQPYLYRTPMIAPDYGSGASAGVMSNSNFNTSESDGRPGVEDYKTGMLAYNRKDYEHAVYMLKVAASWGYKPAEYNLGVMYFQGDGVPADRSLGAAWLVLAAEGGDPRYVAARDWAITSLSKTEFTRTDELWGQLKKTYGDEVALRRAKAQWAFVKANQTGTRVGGTVGELRVGTAAQHGSFKTAMTAGDSAKSIPFGTTSWMNVLTGGSTDGAIAYDQFMRSDNPYDPIFLKNRTGTATVEPLQVLRVKKVHPQSSKPIKQTDQPVQNPSSI
jgi:hypothetical protein